MFDVDLYPDFSPLSAIAVKIQYSSGLYQSLNIQSQLSVLEWQIIFSKVESLNANILQQPCFLK